MDFSSQICLGICGTSIERNHLHIFCCTSLWSLWTVIIILFRIWLAVSKETPKELTKRFRDQELTLESFRQESTYSVLNRYVPTAAMLGGMIIGLLTVVGDLLDVIGSSKIYSI